MKKKMISAALLLTATGAMAQETYESAQLATQDLNGTARYVGMGGALEALGADISTMSTNPAGIGMFRRAWIGTSGGATVTKDGFGGQKTNADFNQMGFVISTHSGVNSAFNFGVNYHKSTNFNQIISAVNSLDQYSSANKLTYLKYAGFTDQLGSKSEAFYALSQAERMTYNTVNYQMYDEAQDMDYYKGASDYVTQRDRSGYISEFDFNISGNINDRVYLGFTVGLKDVHYRSQMNYGETLASDSQLGTGSYSLYDYRTITGTGVDLKFGTIIRPIEESPFRFGLYVHTPTWYTLTCNNDMEADGTFPNGKDLVQSSSNSYEYKITTPWRFGASLGHTFGKIVAIGLTYEFSDYSSIKNKIIEGYSYSYGRSEAITSDDVAMNKNTDRSLKGVHLLKVGAEVRPIDKLAIRVGYNYESAIYDQYGSKDYCIDSDLDYGSVGSYYTTYDYTNWKDTHRFTLGLGYTISKNWTIDLAYQFSTQKGEYHPFQTVSDSDKDWACNGTVTDVKNDRHQINCTLGYRF